MKIKLKLLKFKMFCNENVIQVAKGCITTHFEHFNLFVVPPLEIERIVPKKETFSVPQFGQGP